MDSAEDGVSISDSSLKGGEDKKPSSIELEEGHQGKDSEKPKPPTIAESQESEDPMILDTMQNFRIGVEETETPMMLDGMKKAGIGAEETEDATILNRMRNVGIGVVTVGTTGTFAFLQVSTRNMHDYSLKFIHCACNLCFGMSSLIAALVVLIICILTPKSPSSIMKLKYALRLANFLVMMGYVLAVAFILIRG